MENNEESKTDNLVIKEIHHETPFPVQEFMSSISRENEYKSKIGQLEKEIVQLRESTTLRSQTQRERWIYIALFISTFYNIITGSNTMITDYLGVERMVGTITPMFLIIFMIPGIMTLILTIVILSIIVNTKKTEMKEQ